MMSFIVAALLLPAPTHAAPVAKTRYEMCVEQCLSWMDTPSAARNQCFARCSIANNNGKSQFMTLMKQTVKQASGECETYEECEQERGSTGSTDMDGNDYDPSEPGPDDVGSDF